MKVLVAEDNFLAGLEIKDRLEELGYTVVGPIGDSAAALELVEREPIDAAVLDIRLRTDTSFGVAAALRAKSCPFCFVTGYSSYSELPPELAEVPRVKKPFTAKELQSVLGQLGVRRAGE